MSTMKGGEYWQASEYYGTDSGAYHQAGGAKKTRKSPKKSPKKSPTKLTRTKIYNGRAYIVRRGERGGKYILVKGERVYV